jgi:hypothetical protein
LCDVVDSVHERDDRCAADLPGGCEHKSSVQPVAFGVTQRTSTSRLSWSVPSRRKLASHSRMSQRRELPRSFGSSPINP